MRRIAFGRAEPSAPLAYFIHPATRYSTRQHRRRGAHPCIKCRRYQSSGVVVGLVALAARAAIASVSMFSDKPGGATLGTCPTHNRSLNIECRW
jgi:hypothetical protein